MKKIIKRANAGATYRRDTYAKACRIVMDRIRRYYPVYYERWYESWYYSQKMTQSLNSMMEANGFEQRFDINVVVAREAA